MPSPLYIFPQPPLLSLPSSPPITLAPPATSYSPAVARLAMEGSANASDAAVLKAISRKERALRRQAEEEAEAQSLHQQALGMLFTNYEINTHLVTGTRQAKKAAMNAGANSSLGALLVLMGFIDWREVNNGRGSLNLKRAGDPDATEPKARKSMLISHFYECIYLLPKIHRDQGK